MEPYKDTEFQVYRQPITNNKPIKLVTLDQFLVHTQEAPIHIINVFDKIAEAKLAGNDKEKKRLKQKYLCFFTPCAVVEPTRSYENIKRFTGILVLDFDKIENAPEFKQYLFETYRCIIACWLSPTRKGVKALVRIPVVQTVDEFKEYYFGIETEMEQFNGYDPSCQNCVLPLFQSYDPDLLDRQDAETWTIKGSKRNAKPLTPALPAPIVDVTDKDKRTIIKIIDTAFNNITDTGHPVLRSLCLTIGGYVATGYIDEYDAIDYINHKIENHHYLSKGIYGYQKTARWAIQEGKRNPLTLNYRSNG